jgi:hypothetical protein
MKLVSQSTRDLCKNSLWPSVTPLWLSLPAGRQVCKFLTYCYTAIIAFVNKIWIKADLTQLSPPYQISETGNEHARFLPCWHLYFRKIPILHSQEGIRERTSPRYCSGHTL